MKQRDLWLAVGAIVVIALAILLKPDMQETPSDQTRYDALAPGLKDQVNAVSRVVLEQGAQLQTTLVQGEDGQWNVKERSGFPADTAAIRKLLLHVAQSEIRTAKTDDPAKWHRLALDDKQATSIQFYSDDTLLHHIWLGKVSSEKTTTYVRTGESPQTYLTSGQLNFTANPNDWLRYKWFELARHRVQSVAFQFDGKRDYVYARSMPKDTMEFSPLPADKRLKTSRMVIDASSYLERFAFTDVLSANRLDKEQAQGDAKDVTRFTTFGGLVIEVAFYMIDYQEWASVKAYVDPLARVQEVTKLPSLEALRAEAQQINALTKGWLYQISPFHYNKLRRSYYDIVELR